MVGIKRLDATMHLRYTMSLSCVLNIVGSYAAVLRYKVRQRRRYMSYNPEIRYTNAVARVHPI